MTSVRHVVGCMTGTSIDAIDAALVRIEGRGLSMLASFVDLESQPLGPLATGLRAFANQSALSAGEITAISHEFSVAHARAIRQLASRHPNLKIDLICIHGQTVYHKPPLTWQMFNPWPVVSELGIPVVFDLRGLDAALGGQGAPMTPVADWVFFRSQRPRAIVNLGGFCNVTLLPASAMDEDSSINDIRGFDVCACNQLLDALARAVLNADFDKDGEAAARGAAHPEATRDLESRLARQLAQRRSLGTGDEALAWIESWRSRVKPEGLAKSACAAIGSAIGASVGKDTQIILAGGGVHNLALRTSIHTAAGRPVHLTDDFGLPASAREAAEMAVLGALCEDGVPITLPEVTGRATPVHTLMSGTWAGRPCRG